MSKDAFSEIEKLHLRLSNLRRVEDEAHISLELCLDKWQKLIEYLSQDNTLSQNNVLSLRLEAYETLDDALEKQSKIEHERSHMAESLGFLLLDVERSFQDYLTKGKVT